MEEGCSILVREPLFCEKCDEMDDLHIKPNSHPSSTPMTFTCVSCSLEFSSAQDQRIHMKSEWHRYNLKRRVASLPPIDEISFEEKIQESKDSLEGGNQQIHLKRKEKSKARMKASPVSTTLGSENQRKAKPGSTNELDDNSGADIEGNVKDILAKKLVTKIEIAPTTCLFCPAKKQASFATIEENVQHMWKSHGMYIPERKYVIDLPGLLSYFGEKIGFGNFCLLCSFQGQDLNSVRDHMLSKHHTRIPYETDFEKMEYADFYDFSSSYKTTSGNESDGSGPESDWEDLSDQEIEEDSFSEEELHDTVSALDTEIILPNGRTIGHRSLQRYYRQNFAPERILSEGQGTIVAAESRHFVRPQNVVASAEQKRVWSNQVKRDKVNDKRAAKFINNQPHFRDPLLQ